ncbi:MAG: ABC-type transport auxiliary lipoprotein family protein [Ferrovibrio sp.]
MNKIDRRGLLLAAAALPLTGALSACGGLIPQAPPSNIYNLSPKTTFPDDLPKVDWQLVVEEPYAAGGLDSHKIAIYTNPYEVKYFAEARWAERAPRMVQTLLVESFENTGKIVAVGRQSVGLRSDFNLKSDLREFQAVLKEGQTAPEILIVLQAKMIAQPRQQIVASATFERRAQAKSAAILSVVEAFDDALGKILRDTVRWAMTVKKDVA